MHPKANPGIPDDLSHPARCAILYVMNRVVELRTGQNETRIDRYIAKEIPDLSRTQVQRLLDEGLVTVNGQVPKASYLPVSGDLIVVQIPPPEPVETGPEPIPLKVIYEDAQIIVVDKPAGMVVHPAYGHRSGTLVNALLAHCTDLAGIGGELRPGIVHRLDKDTSGLIVAAKSDAALLHLQRQFKQRLVSKTYTALVEGRLPSAHGVIDAPIGRDRRQRKRMAIAMRGGREARTEYTVLELFPNHTMVEARPLTGRTHQIRIHLASIGHPLVGDPVYGYRRQQLPLQRQFLHASVLAFDLASGEHVEFRSPMPEDLTEVLELLRREE
jgi:23S rRNA pseudouridine1911/1915/1917 synthase